MKNLNELFDLDKLIEYYGTTIDYNNCGYILPNGQILNYKKNNVLYEHFEVEKFYKKSKCKCIEKNNKPICENKKYCRYSIRNYFLYYGAVRCIPSASMPILNIASFEFNKSIVNGFIEHCLFYLKKEMIIELKKFKKSSNEGQFMLHDINSLNINLNCNNYESFFNISERFLNG